MPSLFDPDGLEREHLHNLAALGGARVLEIGCGDGRLTWVYASPSRSVTATDPDAARLATALNNCPAGLRATLSFSQTRAEALPFANGGFDRVLMAWSF